MILNKKNLLLLEVLLCVVGSFICFYATNLILSDVANMFYMYITKDVISSLPFFLAAVELVIASICMLHLGLFPDEQKHILKLNALAIAAISFVGLICSVFTGYVIYGSFTSPYPFPGATILTLLYHLVILGLAVFVYIKCRDAEPVHETVSKRIWYAVQYVFLAIFIYYAFDRFGAVLWAPSYVQFSTLHKTFFFYLSLLLPVFLLLHHCRFRLDLYKDIDRAGIVFPVIYLIADILLCISVVTGGINDTQFVSAISPALGIERLLSKPVVTIAHFTLVTVPVLGSLTAALIKNRKHKKA